MRCEDDLDLPRIGEADANEAATPSPDAQEEDDVAVEGEHWPLLPPGEYRARYTHHETAITFRTAKVFVHFRIVEPGPQFDKQLYRAYRVTRLLGRHGRGGRFTLGPRSELYLQLCRLRRPSRPNRVSLRWLKGVVLRMTVRTVVKDSQQRPLPECLHYSVVDSIVAIEVGVPHEPITC